MLAATRRPRGKGPVLWFEPPLVLGLAALLDFLLADPWDWPHPVQAMGWVINCCSPWIWRLDSPQMQRLAGVVLGLGLVFGSGAVGWGLVAIARRVDFKLAVILQIILVASCLAGRSLRRAANAVLTPLEQGNLGAARQQLGLYVGRDTDNLNPPEILRAVLETVSENTTDGVTAPFFYAVLGAFIPGIGPVPAALAYKAASTLDSMVGYKQPPYQDLGWFSARFEDALTWLPCRLTVFTIAVISGHPARVVRLCLRDASTDPSPNAGWSECAYAAALGVQMGGTNYYHGQLKIKPKLGEPHRPITPERIKAALGLTRWMFLLWLAAALLTFIALAEILD